MSTPTDPRHPPPADQPETRILLRGVDRRLVDRIIDTPHGPSASPGSPGSTAFWS